MADGELNTAMAAPLSNTVMVFVCVLLLSWFLKASRRFARTILLRRSLIHGNIVQIQGLASFLSYFDGATRSHINSVVQTRQAKPAIPMDMLFVPCLFHVVQMTPTSTPDIFSLTIKIHVTMPGSLYMMSNFDINKFKSLVIQTCRNPRGANKRSHSSGGGRDVGNIFRGTIFGGNSSMTQQYAQQFPFLAQQEVCLADGLAHELSAAGGYSINLSFRSPFVANVADTSTFDIALCFVPDTEHGRVQQGGSVSPLISGVTKGLTGALSPASRAPVYYTGATPMHSTSPDVESPHSSNYQHDLQRSSSLDSQQKLLSSPVNDDDIVLDETPGHNHGLRRRAGGGNDGNKWLQSGMRLVSDIVSDLVEHNVFSEVSITPSAPAPINNDEPHDIEQPPSADGAATPPASSLASQFPAESHHSSTAGAVIFNFSLPKHLHSLFPAAATTVDAAAPAGGTEVARKKELHPRDILLVDGHGHLYLSQEVFGLGAVPVAPPVTPTPPVSEPTTNHNGSSAVSSNGSSSPPIVNTGYRAATTSNNSNAQLSPDTLLSHHARVAPFPTTPHTSSSTNATTSTGSTYPSTPPKAAALGYRSANTGPATPGVTAAGTAGTATETATRSPTTTENAQHNHNPSSSAADTNNNSSSISSSSVSSSLAMAQGGKYVVEECVVCMTDPKEILLLPCRHLSVCKACFVFVDKCPVCRALFDEYVAIQGDVSVALLPQQTGSR